MNNFFAMLLLGHCVGDFWLQPKWMAVNKQASSLKCLVHATVYSLAVYLFTYHFITGYKWFFFILVPHFVIDRYSLADKWLDFINGRSLKDYMQNGNYNIPFVKDTSEWSNYHVLRGGFTSVVYTITDNSFHLVLMYCGAYWLHFL